MAHIRSRFVLCLAVVVVLVLAAGGLVTAAPPDGVAKGPPQMDKIVSIHYPRGLEAKGGVPGGPDKPGKPDGGTKDWFKYSGIHWAIPDVKYSVNLLNSGGDETFLAGVIEAFDEWEDAPSGIGFECLGLSSDAPSSFVGDEKYDGSNQIGWVDISSRYPRAIAVTMTWYNTQTGLIAEVDLAFNAALSWAQADIGAVDPDTVTGVSGYYDVQNIATHEAGHWLLLGDLYNKPTATQTMYGYGSKGELQKRSLESGDIAGVQTIYPS